MERVKNSCRSLEGTLFKVRSTSRSIVPSQQSRWLPAFQTSFFNFLFITTWSSAFSFSLQCHLFCRFREVFYIDHRCFSSRRRGMLLFKEKQRNNLPPFQSVTKPSRFQALTLKRFMPFSNRAVFKILFT